MIVATALMFSVPVAPARTTPFESTEPSNTPPLVNQRTETLSSGRPAESYAVATSFRLSPGFSSAAAGRTSTRAIGCGMSVGGRS